MDSSRKAAIRAYKEQKPARGVFAVRCSATGHVWVDSAMDLRAAENRTWSSLRYGDVHAPKAITGEYGTHGRDAFAYEILETLDEDTPAMSLRDVLRERKLHWLEKLAASPLSPV